MKEPQARPPRLFALLAALVFITCGCSSMQSGTRGLFNANLEGDPAPALTGEEWIHPDPAASGEPIEADWQLLTFFRPS